MTLSTDIFWSYKTNFDFEAWQNAFGPDLDKEVYDTIGKKLRDVVLERQASQHGPANRGWQPLSPLTVAMKGHDRAYEKSGELMRGLEVIIYADRMVVGWNVSRFPFIRAIHQGLPGSRKKMVTPKQAIWMWANLFKKKGPPYRVKYITKYPRHLLGWDIKSRALIDEVVVNLLKKTENMGTGEV